MIGCHFTDLWTGLRLWWFRLRWGGGGSAGGIFYIGGAETLPQPLTPEEEQALMPRFGDRDVNRIFIERNLRLVVYVAKRFENSGNGLEDLISIGAIGLIKAINTFDAGKNIKLATYASRCIENEILMFLRKTASRKGEVSLDEPLNTDWDGNELLLGDVLGTQEDLILQPLEDEAERSMLRRAVDRLPSRERKIITMRYGLFGCREKTQKEVADDLGISQSYISRLEKRILSRLKRELIKENAV